MSELKTDHDDYTLSERLSGGFLGDQPLTVSEKPKASLYDPARYRVATPMGELAVVGADRELTHEEKVVVVFADENNEEHVLLLGSASGLSVDGVEFHRTS